MRVDRMMTVSELSLRAKISPSYVFYLESHQKVPTLTTLKKIADALDVPLRDFFT